MTEEQEKAVAMAEKKIQKLLIDLVCDHGLKVVHVEVDTRNYANLNVSIYASD